MLNFCEDPSLPVYKTYIPGNLKPVLLSDAVSFSQSSSQNSSQLHYAFNTPLKFLSKAFNELHLDKQQGQFSTLISLDSQKLEKVNHFLIKAFISSQLFLSPLFLLSVTVAPFEIFCWLFPMPGLSKYGAPEICSILYALVDDMAYPLGFNTTFQYANILFYMVLLITVNTNN